MKRRCRPPGSVASSLPHIKAGRLRLVAVTTGQRWPLLPQTPTIAESGVPGYEHLIWNGLSVRSGTPQPILAKLNSEIAAIQKLPETQKRLATEGAEVVLRTPAEMRSFVPQDITKWAKVAADAGMKKQ